MESKNQLVSQIGNSAPDTIKLFTEKDALLRELRSQINQKDLLLMEYARQVAKLKKTRNQLAAGESLTWLIIEPIYVTNNNIH